MRVDDALELLGGYGRYQLLVFVIIGLNFMYTPMHIFSDVFTAFEPEHHCKFPENDTKEEWIPSVQNNATEEESFEQCLMFKTKGENETISCKNEFVYSREEIRQSVITEWHLSCDKSHWLIIITVHGAAAVLGAVVFSPFADTYGRKALFLMCWWQTALLALGMVLVNDISSFLVLRFLSRLYTEVGAELAMFILACEYFPAGQRPFAAFALYLFYATGQMLLAFQAYLTRSWRALQLSITVGVFILLPFSMFLPESPYWLVSWGRIRSAELIFRKAAKFNRVSLPPNFKLDSGADPVFDENDYEETAVSIPSPMRQTSSGETRLHLLHPHLSHFSKLLNYMKNGTLRKDFLIGSFLWAVSAYNYNGLTVMPIKIKVNDSLYLNYFLGGLVMVPAFTSIFFLKRFGRIKPLVVFFATAGVFIIAYSIIPTKTASGYHLGVAHLCVKLVAKCATTAALVSTRLLVAELFPTTVRSTCTGLAAFIGFLGGSAGLYFPVVKHLSKWSGVLVGFLSLVAAGFCTFLPETSNRPLPENIKDMMLQYRSVVQNMFFTNLNSMTESKTVSPRISIYSIQNQSPKHRMKSMFEAASAANAVGIAARTKSVGDLRPKKNNGIVKQQTLSAFDLRRSNNGQFWGCQGYDNPVFKESQQNTKL
uniref:Major facilitator superfamily (MFS) profile domain-containing protein n=1 Tax=Strigamia maritima TaxID=126957 RepID=T1J7M3_STRMM